MRLHISRKPLVALSFCLLIVVSIISSTVVFAPKTVLAALTCPAGYELGTQDGDTTGNKVCYEIFPPTGESTGFTCKPPDIADIKGCARQATESPDTPGAGTVTCAANEKQIAGVCTVPTDADDSCKSKPGYEKKELSDPANPTKNASYCVKGAEDDTNGCPIDPNDELKWLYCPVYYGMSGLAGAIDSIINSYLSVGNMIYGSNEPQYKKAWSTFRTFGIALVVIAGLVMLLSEALGLQIIDAYTVRKVLPRLLVAVIGIALSWEICKFLISLFDDLGIAMGDIIYSSFDHGVDGVNVIAVFTTALLGTGGIITYAALVLKGWGILTLAGMLALGMLIGMVVLVLRQAIIVACVLMAPLAIAAYILPNTTKLASFWWDAFIRMLMLFPIATGLIALCKSLGYIAMTPGDAAAASINGSVQHHSAVATVAAPAAFVSGPFGRLGAVAGGPIGDLVSTVSGVIFFFMGYALLPLAARFTGGLVATIGGFANDKARGPMDSMKNKLKENNDYNKQNTKDRVTARRSDLNSKLQKTASNTNKSAFQRKLAGVAGKAVSGRNIEARMSEVNARRSKELGDQIATGDDGEIRALTVNKAWADQDKTRAHMRITEDEKGNKTREYRTLGGTWVNEGQVDSAHARWGKNASAQQAALSYETRKASTEEQTQYLAENYRNVAQGGVKLDSAGNVVKNSKGEEVRTGGWGMSDNRAGGAWMGSAFENAGKHVELKSVNWKTGNFNGKDGNHDLKKAGKFIDEVYEQKGSYSLSQMNSNTIEQLKNVHTEAGKIVQNKDKNYSVEQVQVAQRQMDKVAAISETFMHGAAGGVQDKEGNYVPDGAVAGGRERQFSAQGAASVTERAHELAVQTGVKRDGPKGSYIPGTQPTDKRREQG